MKGKKKKFKKRSKKAKSPMNGKMANATTEKKLWYLNKIQSKICKENRNRKILQWWTNTVLNLILKKWPLCVFAIINLSSPLDVSTLPLILVNECVLSHPFLSITCMFYDFCDLIQIYEHIHIYVLVINFIQTYSGARAHLNIVSDTILYKALWLIGSPNWSFWLITYLLTYLHI